MSPRRVLLVGRRFWPHNSFDSANFLCQLATGLKRHGLYVEVLTPRYSSHWPVVFQYREIPVHRPMAAPRSDWSKGRYARHLSHWIHENAERFDLVLVDAIGEEFAAISDAISGMSLGSIVLCQGWGDDSDVAKFTKTRAGRRHSAAAKLASRIIVRDKENEKQLISQRFPAQQIVRIPTGFSSQHSISEDNAKNREQARVRLAAVNSDLSTVRDTPVILAIGRMEKESGMELLCESAPPLLSRYNDLRLWLIGDGPRRTWMYNYLRGEGVRPSFAMPGTFSDLEDVLFAADVFVQADHDGLDYALPAAVAVGLPIVAIDTTPVRSVLSRMVGPGKTEKRVTWFSGQSPHSLRLSLRSVLEAQEEARNQALLLRRDLVRHHCFSQVVSSIASQIDNVISEKCASSGLAVSNVKQSSPPKAEAS